MGDVSRRRWRVLGRQFERLLAGLTCLGPILMLPYQPTLSEAITEGGENQTLARDGFRESITDTRPAVVGVVG